jgi:NitT/TauT family transport system substrate-binding protein
MERRRHMQEKQLENAFERRIDRRGFLTRTAGAGFAVSGLGTLLAACGGDDEPSGAGGGATGGTAGGERATVRWISPRGTLDVMDDYNLWVPIEQGYFDELNIDVELIAGPGGNATASATFVAQDQADMGYPSPGVLTSSIDGGVPVKSAWEMISGQVFNFSLPEDSDITEVTQLEGKTMSVLTAGWKVIVDPILVEVGVDPESIKYLESGPQWNQVVSQGKADAGLAWEGLRAQLAGQGLKLKYLLGSEFSEGPSNSYVVRSADLDDEGQRDVFARFFKGVVMGMTFAKTNPQAAAQITYRKLPDLAATLEPQLALESMIELATAYGTTEREGNGFGYHPVDAWENYIKNIADLGQIKNVLPVDDVVTNDFVGPANSEADVDRARSDAEAFELDDDFSQTTVPEGTNI